MLKDRDGFMWFGTQDGLNLWDGEKFRIFQNQPGDPGSLSNNYIVSICEDEEGFLWIGTMTGGLNRFNKHTERFTVFRHSDSLNSLSENTVWTVLSDRNGNIWAGTSIGLNRYDKGSGQFTIFRPDPLDEQSLVTEMVVSLFKDSSGRIWIGTVEGLCCFDGEKKKFVRYYNPYEEELDGANIIWSISETPAGRIITGTDHGVYLLEPESRKYTRILGSPSEAQIVAWSVICEDSGNIWTGTDRGLFFVEDTSGESRVYLHDPANPKSIGNNNIWCLLADPSGFLWAGTNDGISKTEVSAAHFRLLSSEPGHALTLSSSRVMAVLEDSFGFLWIGTDGGGLNCISPDGKRKTVYTSANSGLRNDNVWALAEDAAGNIYIGNYQGGLHRFDRETGTIYAYPLVSGGPYSLSNKRVLALLVSSEGDVWIATRGGGLSRLNPETGKFRDYMNSRDDPSGFPANTVLSLRQDASGRIWAGTQEGGLALYMPSSDNFITFRHEAANENSLSDNNIWAIRFDRNGRMWIGSQGGLNVCEEPGENMKFRYFTILDGLSSNFIMGIEEDTEGNIWMSTFNGLDKLNINVYESLDINRDLDETYAMFHPLFTVFDPDHGLQGLEFNQGSSHKGRSGILYFGGNKGLNYFSDIDVRASDYNPPVLITGIKIFNKDVSIDDGLKGHIMKAAKLLRKGKEYVLPEKITYLDELMLTYRESVISFEFSSLDYLNPHKNQYAYKMADFDKNWNYVGSQNTATYTNLDPGEYTFLIRGSNSDGVWNPAEKALKIIITPPVWKTGWFMSLSVIALILFIFMVIRQVFINQKRKAEKEKEVIELQLRTIKSQIDPHFAFNAINSIASYIITEHPETAYDYFTRFARMIRKILEDNEKISVNLQEELDFVRNYLELQKMRFKDKFEYSITLGEDVPGDMPVPKLIIQSYAENAIKHGLMHRKSGGLLTIDIRKADPGLCVTVEDNGIGREKAALLNPGSTHRGIRIVEHLSVLYKRLYNICISQEIEDLKDGSGEPSGTRVVLRIYPHEGKPGKRKRKLLKLIS
jgi:ligand-binding sensor domain-containing protein